MIGRLPIRGKMLAEDMGIAGAKTFTDPGGENLSDADRKLLESKMAELTQQGYGKRKGKAKSKRAPSNWVIHCKAFAKKNNLTYGQAMKQAGPSSLRKMIS